jgi:exonuclease 3'-5' domain-containing protein 1
MHRRHDTQSWMIRPLPWKLLCYAAADIYLITLLYEDFSSKGWLSLGSKFLGRCHRYVSMHEGHGRIKKDHTGRFQTGPLIPLGILNGGGELKNCWRTKCITCGRSQTLFAYETDGHGSRRKVCRLCWAIAAKHKCVCDDRWVRIDIKTASSSL